MMKRPFFALCVLLALALDAYSQTEKIVDLGPKSEPLPGSYNETSNHGEVTIDQSTVHLLTIGIQTFEDSFNFCRLASADTLINQFRVVAKDFLPLTYSSVAQPRFLNNPIVKRRDVLSALTSLSEEVGSSSIVIISIISHGAIDANGEYYLVCSDTRQDKYSQTAVSGSELRKYFEKMANKGAIVLVFLDTCHAAALFDVYEKDDTLTPTCAGSIAYFGASERGESAKEISSETAFTRTVIEIFNNKYEQAFHLKKGSARYATIGSFKAQIPSSIKQLKKEYQQTPTTYYWTNCSQDYIDQYPIVIQKQLKPYGTIWEYPQNLTPWAISPTKGKWVDYALIGVEAASLAGIITCGIIQESCKSKIKEFSDDPVVGNDYKKTGKSAAIGCWVSTGLLIGSYVGKIIHVHIQCGKEFREEQYASLDLQPVLSPSVNGISLVYRF